MKLGRRSLFARLAAAFALASSFSIANAQTTTRNVNFEWTVTPTGDSATAGPITCSGAFAELGGNVTLTQVPNYGLPSISIFQSPTFEMSYQINTPLNRPTDGLSPSAWNKLVQYDEAVTNAFKKYMDDQCNADQTRRVKSPRLPQLIISPGNITLTILTNQ